MKLNKRDIKYTLIERATKVILDRRSIGEALDKKMVGVIFKELATMFSKTAGDEKAAKVVVDNIKKTYSKKNPEEVAEVIKKFLD